MSTLQNGFRHPNEEGIGSISGRGNRMGKGRDIGCSRRHERAGVVAEGPFQLLRHVPVGKTVLLLSFAACSSHPYCSDGGAWGLYT